MTIDSKEFGKHIRKLRNEKGMSLRKCAKEAEVSVAYLSYIERGIQGVPSEKIIKKIAHTLETNPDALLALAGKLDSGLSQSFLEFLSEHSPENEITTEQDAKEASLDILNFLVLQCTFNEMIDLEKTPLGNSAKTYEELKEKLSISGGLPKSSEQMLLEHFEAVIKRWREDFDR